MPSKCSMKTKSLLFGLIINQYMSCTTTSNPLGDEPAIRHRWWSCSSSGSSSNTHYQQNYSGVDRSKQYRSKNPVGRPSKKFWKYFMNFIFEISIINSFLLWLNTPGTAKPTKHYSLNEFSLDIAQCLMGDFSSRKRLWKVQPHGASFPGQVFQDIRMLNLLKKEAMQMVQFSRSKTWNYIWL